MEVIQLDGYTLIREQIEKIAKGYAQVSLATSALERVRESRARIEKRLTEGQAIYGVNTGFGKLSDVQIA